MPKLIKAVMYYDDGTAYKIEGERAGHWQELIVSKLRSLQVDGQQNAAVFQTLSAWTPFDPTK